VREHATATTQLEQLVAKRTRATARVAEVQAEWRLAGQTLQAARESLVTFEGRGNGRQAERSELEAALADAKARADEPWAERVEGAQRHERDAHRHVQEHVAENLDELVGELERQGAVAASSLNAAARALLDAYSERENVAQQIGALVALIARVEPGDVSRTRAEQAAQALRALVEAGGEHGPVLRRDPRLALRRMPAAAAIPA
jgi:hypothetical protein